LENLLFLAHRIPYPPNKGDKIRSWHLLERLARDYRIYLGTFVDDPRDWVHVPHVRNLCEDAHFSRLNPLTAKLRSSKGLLSGGPLSVPHYRDDALQRWVDATLSDRDISRALVFSSVMAQYVIGKGESDVRTVVDFVDVDSDKWRQYSETCAWPMQWVYAREGRCLLEYERTVSLASDASVFVSRDEANLFANLAPECASRITHINNGIDTDKFSPDIQFDNPYASDDRVVVFTGAMDYRANIDAVVWFAREVFPVIRARIPNARFFVVGTKPAAAVKALESNPGITVTGAVEDVRPYLAHASLSVAPMRIARGVQNKVLEALSMGIPLVATTAAMEGLEPWPEGTVRVVDDAQSFANDVVEILTDASRPVHVPKIRQWLADYYSWPRNLAMMAELLEEAGGSAGEASAVGVDPRSRAEVVG